MSSTYYTYTSQPRASAVDTFGSAVTYRTLGSSAQQFSTTVPRSLYSSYGVEELLSSSVSARSSAELPRAQTVHTLGGGTRTYVPRRGAYWLGKGETSLSQQEVQSNSREARWLPGGNTTKSNVRLENSQPARIYALPSSTYAGSRVITREPVLRTYLQRPLQQQTQARQHQAEKYAPNVSYRAPQAQATRVYHQAPRTYCTSAPYDTSVRMARSYTVQDGLNTSARFSNSYADPYNTSARSARLSTSTRSYQSY